MGFVHRARPAERDTGPFVTYRLPLSVSFCLTSGINTEFHFLVVHGSDTLLFDSVEPMASVVAEGGTACKPLFFRPLSLYVWRLESSYCFRISGKLERSSARPQYVDRRRKLFVLYVQQSGRRREEWPTYQKAGCYKVSYKTRRSRLCWVLPASVLS